MSRRTEQFVSRLQKLADAIPHQELAEYLGIKRTLLRNWLYRDTPTEWAVTTLEGPLNRKWDTTFNNNNRTKPHYANRKRNP